MKLATRILIGGSPCTYWSIARGSNREVKAEGLGWELFRNYLIAKERFKPDFFLYENNSSASKDIQNQIKNELGGVLIHINSSLVSAQNRKRFYVCNWDNVSPTERRVQLKDILETNKAVVENEKSYCLTAGRTGNTRDYLKKHHSQIAFEPIKIGSISKKEGQANRVYSSYGKSVCLMGNGGGQGGHTGLYFTPLPQELVGLVCDKGKIYNVENGILFTKFGNFNVNLDDGLYLIRKLTIKECCRLQTLPDDYCDCPEVSNTQKYKGLGNGWTAEVIIHLLKEGLKNISRNEPIEVLSMYDGIGTGRYCFDKLGFKNITYKAYEIDKYAKQIAKYNYPDIVECGDAFDVRSDEWNYKLIN